MSGCTEDLKKIIQSYITEEEYSSLLRLKNEQNEKGIVGFDLRFAKIRRALKRSTQALIVNEKETCENKLIIENWDILRLTRVWFISLLSSYQKEEYCQALDELFEFADVKELVALYSSLSLIPFPEYALKRCEEGIRGNIGAVHEAIMENNRFPVNHLDQTVWNQMVLKAFFTDKNVLNIQGLFDAMNASLARAAKDYILERNAANRSIHPVLWVLAQNELNNERILSVFQRELKNSDDEFKKYCLSYTLHHNAFLKENIKQDHPNITGIQPTLNEIKNFYR